MQRFIKATLACLVLVGFLAAGEYTGLVTAVTKDTVTVLVKKKGEKKAEEKVLKHKGPKILKGKDELKVEDVTKAIEESKGKVKGVAAKLTTEGEGDAEIVVKIEVGGGKKKKDN
ncbi:MAG: hypothetical protein EBV06_00545 [Planctomycetia bacterium]|nr:hypothetical protein [Planctomycetia bacterium]